MNFRVPVQRRTPSIPHHACSYISWDSLTAAIQLHKINHTGSFSGIDESHSQRPTLKRASGSSDGDTLTANSTPTNDSPWADHVQGSVDLMTVTLQ